MVSCHEADTSIEAIATGEHVAEAVRTHVETCARCASRLRQAQRIEQLLADRPSPEPPAMFTTTLLGRLRRDRRRTEQILDWGFNAAVAIGVALIAMGIGGLIYASGLVEVSRDLYSLVDLVSGAAAARLAEQARTFVFAAFLLTLTLGVWWWIEEDLTT
jgi:hypothetical protein